MKVNWLFGLFVLLLVPATAQAEKYSFGVHEKFVNVAFESRMDIEDILGTTNKVSGMVDFAEKGAFRLVVPVDSLRTGIDLRDDHLRSQHWLDAAKYPEIVFDGSAVKELSPDKIEVSGALWIHGVSRELTLVVDMRRISKETAKKLGLGEERWLRVRASFQVRLSDHGVTIPDMAAAKVNDEWTVKVSLFAKEI